MRPDSSRTRAERLLTARPRADAPLLARAHHAACEGGRAARYPPPVRRSATRANACPLRRAAPLTRAVWTAGPYCHLQSSPRGAHHADDSTTYRCGLARQLEASSCRLRARCPPARPLAAPRAPPPPPQSPSAGAPPVYTRTNDGHEPPTPRRAGLGEGGPAVVHVDTEHGLHPTRRAAGRASIAAREQCGGKRKGSLAEHRRTRVARLLASSAPPPAPCRGARASPPPAHAATHARARRAASRGRPRAARRPAATRRKQEGARAR